MTEVTVGDRVGIIGEVTSVTPHKNGIVGVTVRFGEGVERQVVVPDTAVCPAEFLETAVAFDVIPYDRTRYGLRHVQVVKRGIDAWAIVGDCGCLAHDGEWEYEPLPSSRSEEFFERCRWYTAAEAMEFAKEHMRRYPSGYKDDHRDAIEAAADDAAERNQETR
jgi:hypothetical protein